MTELINRTHMLIEALEYYIQDLKKNNCTEASIHDIQTLNKLRNEIRNRFYQ